MGLGRPDVSARGTRVRTMLRTPASLASDVSQPCIAQDICPPYLCLTHLQIYLQRHRTPFSNCGWAWVLQCLTGQKPGLSMNCHSC